MKIIIEDPAVNYRKEFTNWKDFYADKYVIMWKDWIDLVKKIVDKPAS